MERPYFVLVAAAACLCCCDKPPPEPASTPLRSSSKTLPESASTATTAEKRCVVPLPTAAPNTPPPAAKCPVDPVFGGVKLAKAKVAFPESSDSIGLDVELATTADQQERGLMYRTKMAETEGMLFVFGLPSIHRFWMHNTCISLDMMFLDQDGHIAGIVESAPTLDDGERSIPCPVSYVLEVNAGFSRRHGIKPGQRVQLPK